MKNRLMSLSIIVPLLALGFSTFAATDTATAGERNEVQINNLHVTNNQDHATAAMAADGTYVITWHSYEHLDDGDGAGVAARIFQMGGAAPDEFLVNQFTTAHQRTPDVSTNGSARFVIVWDCGGDPANYKGHDVRACVMSDTGAMLVPDFVVDPAMNRSESRTWPDVAMYANGDFVVIWGQQELNSVPPRQDFYVRLFDANGQPHTAAPNSIQINQNPSDALNTSGGFGIPDIAVNASNEVVAVWEKISTLPARSVAACREFNLHTAAFDPEYELDAPPAGTNQRRPMVDINDAGCIVVTWSELIGNIQNDIDIMVRRCDPVNGWEATFCAHQPSTTKNHRSAVTLEDLGCFTVAWSKVDALYANDVYLSRYDKNSALVFGEELVTSEPATRTRDQQRPAIGFAEQGGGNVDMVISWESDGQDGDKLGVFAKEYQLTCHCEYRYDDGTPENILGMMAAGDICWMHRFDTKVGCETIIEVKAIFGCAMFPGYSPGNGTPCEFYIWDDPSNDGDPSDCVLLTMEYATVRNVDTDIMNVYAITSPPTVFGEFYVGCKLTHSAGQYTAPIDVSTPYVAGNAFLCGTGTPGSFDPNYLMNNQYPPAESSNYWCLRARGD